MTGGGFKAMQYVMSCARQVGTAKLANAVRSRNTCKACAFGTGGQRGGLHNEYSKRIEICNKNIQAQLSDIRDPIPPEIFEHNTIAELKCLSGKQLEDLGRLAVPLHKAAGEDSYRPIAYQDAYQLIASKMRSSEAGKSFFYSSGRSSNEAAFILQLFARIYGCNHINNCSYYCHQASGLGLKNSIGTGTATIKYADLHQTDTLFVFGANPASNHPRFVKTLLECRQRGGNVIVVNPAREAGLVKFASPSNFKSMISGGGEVASHYVQVHIGGDVALISGIAKLLLESDRIQRNFIDSCCQGFIEYERFILALNWSDICRESGLDKAQIEDLADIYADSEKAVFAWGMGLTHHRNGTDNVEAIANLALLRGMIGAQGAGLLPLRGHSNVQGVSSMGFTPALSQSLCDTIERELHIKLPQHQGMDTLACVQAAAKAEIDFALLLGGNLFSANPDTAFSERALDAIPFKVMINSTLNQTHVHGVGGENLILPIRVRDEERQATTQESMFNYVRMSDGGFDRIEGLQSEIEIICGIAEKLIDPSIFDFSEFRQHQHIRQSIAKLIPGFEAMAKIDQSKEEFHISGRHLSKPEFNTASGKASFCLPQHTNWQKRPTKHKEFTLSSVRSEGQFNTIIYSEEDIYRQVEHRQILFANPQDIEKLGFKPGDKVNVSSSTGTMHELELTAYAIRQGNMMCYFPEANVLVSQDVDARSRTPAFKSVQVTISRAASVAT